MGPSILLKGLLWLLRKLFGGNVDAQVAAGAAVTKTEAAQVERESDVLKAAAADRAAGDAERLRLDPEAGKVDADRGSAINRNADLGLRD